MQNDVDLLTPLPVELSTPNGMLYSTTHIHDRYLENEYYNFGIDGFTTTDIDDIPSTVVGLSPIQEETNCSLIANALEPVFSPVETAPPVTNFESPNVPAAENPPIFKQLLCDLCSETFSTTQALRFHWHAQHISTKEFRCRKCPLSFNFESNLLLHLASHVPSCSTNKQCPECHKKFNRISSFKGHLKAHQTSDRFKCSRCDKEFEFKDYYEKHLTKAHKHGIDGTVEEILYRAVNKSRLRKKSKLVKGRYRCQHCEKKFLKPCLLKRHEVSHTGEKPFQCNECNQGFTQKTSLERHMLLHQGVKEFICPKCNHSFSQKNNLIVHIQRAHPVKIEGDGVFVCESCPCVFKTLRSVNRHRSMEHPEINNSADNEDDEDDNVNVARVMEQLKSFQESMRSIDTNPPELELSIVKPPSPEPVVNTITVIDTINPKKEKTYTKIKEIIYKGHRTIACVYCDKPFKRQYDLLRHLRTHTQEKPYKCNTCHKSFSTSCDLKRHLKIHRPYKEIPSKAYQCAADDCHKRFSSLRALDIHTKNHSVSISYMCPVCAKIFISKAGYSSHKHISKDKELESIRPFLEAPIPIKNEKETNKALKEEEYAKRNYQCSVCGLKVKNMSRLKQHEATHSEEKPFQCGICFRTYSSRSSLNLHLKIHTGEKNHICEVCNAKFNTNCMLVRHMISHSDETKFSCPYCYKRFKTNDSCKAHILTHARSLLATPKSPSRDKSADSIENHEETPASTTSQQYIAIVQSPESNLSPKFIQLELVKNCKRHKHKNFTIETLPPNKSPEKSIEQSVKHINQTRRHTCRQCGKSFLRANDVLRHKRTHTKEKPYRCTMCSKQFSLMSTLVTHRKIHDPQRETFDCQVCGKKYATQMVLTVHLRIHTGERPFECEVCKRTFRTPGHKIAHIKAHHKKS